MAADVIDGGAIAQKITDGLKEEIATLTAAGRQPHLVAVQVGENPASRIYVRNQKKQCEEVGIRYTLDELPEDTTEAGLLAHVDKLNADPDVSAIILQMPVPAGVNARRVQMQIAPNKDAEGMNPANLGMLLYGGGEIGPCTAVGAVELIKSTGVEVKGKDAVVVGHSEIVGKPIALLLLGLNATTSVCHIFTQDLAKFTRQAEILVVAAGKSQAVWLRYKRMKKKDPNTPAPDLSPLISADMIKPGAIVIDVAINRIPVALDGDGKPTLNKKGKPAMKTVGDVDFEAAKEIASFITPVPGGVGPMTVARLLHNTVAAAKSNG